MGIAIFDRLPRSILLLLGVIILLLSFKSAAHTGRCLPSERSSLLDLIRGVSYDPEWNVGGPLVSWKPGSNCCNWEGVSCDHKSGHVIGLNISKHGIKGNLSGSLFNLTSLQTLDLSYNFFEGEFPQVGVENLTQLTHLNLSSAGFSGQTPIGISRLTNLISLNLGAGYIYLQLSLPSFRTLVGNLSNLRELHLQVDMSSNLDWGSALSSSMPQLQVLSLSYCNLPGLLPTDILTSHTNLTLLDLSGNPMLSGNLPDFPNNNALQSLSFSGTNLSGNIPDFISNLKYLTNLDISHCGLTGMIPSSIGFIGAVPSSIGNLTQLVHLDLSCNEFIGAVPSSIGNLFRISYLNLMSNSFQGPIPTSIGNLSRLSYLELSSNNFKGLIPASIGNLSQLAFLDLQSNNFTGPIPTSIGDLTHLTSIYLRSNFLSGSVPVSLFTLPALETLDLSYNQFSGELKEFSNPSMSLINLDLSNNQLQGQIPISLFKLLALGSLDLSSNSFSGPVELDMKRNLMNLTALDLSRNNILSVQEVSDINYSDIFPNLNYLGLASCNLSKVPAFLRDHHELGTLDISDNKIGGGIPEWIWRLDEGLYLNLSMNKFTHFEGPLLSRKLDYGSLDLHLNSLQGPIVLPSTSFYYLDYSNNSISSVIPSNISSYLLYCDHLLLKNNNLSGEIPASICKAQNLQVLDLSGNSLSGSIPSCLFDIKSLTVLNLKGNQLQGAIPKHFSKECLLEALILSDNRLKGPISQTLLNCGSLKVLDLGNNQIVEGFPSWLGQMVNIIVLILRGNAFHGQVKVAESLDANNTFSKLEIFDLSSNHFNGNFPSNCFNNLKSMMNFSTMNQGDDITDKSGYDYEVSVINDGREITLKRILTISYLFVDFSNNNFQGVIPEVISKLKGLYLLNLSHNALTGKIPLTIGMMMQLEHLDLSANHLCGEIPQQLTSLTFLSSLNLSSNNLTGRIPRGKQFDTFSNTSYLENEGLCGSPLSKQCNNGSPNQTSVLQPTTSNDSSSSTYIIVLGLLIGLGFGVGFAVTVVLRNVLLKFWKRCSSLNWI